ncbi:MAG: cation:proton antiporter [Pseudomonadota bacterium]
MTDFLLLAFIFLFAGVLAVPVATRLGLGSVLGYLMAGMALSPILSILNVDVIAIQHFAEFGVVMMLFLVGLELEPKTLWEMRTKLLGLGGAQVGLTVAGVAGIAMLFGLPWQVSLAIGFVLTLSSTAIVLQSLNEKGLMKSDGGEASFAVLLFQDIAVIPMLAIIPLLALPELADTAGIAADAAHGGGDHAGAGGDAADGHGSGDHGDTMSLVAGLNGWQTTLVTVGAVAAVIFAGSYLTRPLFRFIAGAGLRELFTAAALMIVVGIALLMSLVGLSPALGAFIAGVVLANSEYRHELESDIDPFRGLLLGLFFITVGASINFSLLAQNLLPVLGMTVGLIALKVAVMFALAIAFGLRGANKWLFSLALAQAGEFGFVLLSFTVANGAMPQAISDILLLVVALSMLATPGLFILYDKVIAPRFASDTDSEPDEITEKGSVIIAGVGRFGGVVNRMLKNAGFQTTVVDYSSAQLEMLRTFGVRAYFGDATRPDLLEAAGIRQAQMLIVAIDNKEQTTQLVTYVLQNFPNVHVIARAHDRHHVYDLYAAGCRDIIREVFDSAIRVGRSAFEALGIDKEQAERMAEGFVDDDRITMITLAEQYDPDVPNPENKAYVARAREIMGIQEELMAQDRRGFGRLRQRLRGAGADPDATVERFEREAAQQGHAQQEQEEPGNRPDADEPNKKAAEVDARP